MSKRGLYPTLSNSENQKSANNYMDFLQYADGTNSLEKISKIIKLELKLVKRIYFILLKNNLITS